MTQSSTGPLSGITVIDLSRILAGPYCTFLMAEMGARVIKVEPPKGGDDARAYGPFVNGKSTYFASINRGKELIALDLKNDEHRAIFEKLLEKADVSSRTSGPARWRSWATAGRRCIPGIPS